MGDWYILNADKTVRKAVPGEMALAYRCLEGKTRILAQTEVTPDIMVSTVFLGLDHSFRGDGSNPVLFESLVFGGPDDGHYDRYHTWQEAEEGHRKICANIQSGLSQEELEAAKATIEPLLSQQVARIEERPAAEQPHESVNHDNGQDHYKNDIDDLVDRGREWE